MRIFDNTDDKCRRTLRTYQVITENEMWSCRLCIGLHKTKVSDMKTKVKNFYDMKRYYNNNEGTSYVQHCGKLFNKHDNMSNGCEKIKFCVSCKYQQLLTFLLLKEIKCHSLTLTRGCHGYPVPQLLQFQSLTK